DLSTAMIAARLARLAVELSRACFCFGHALKNAARGERLADMLHLRFIGDHVEHDRAQPLFGEASDPVADLGIAADEIGAVGLEREERLQPIAVLVQLSALAVIEVALPGGVGVTHGQGEKLSILGIVAEALRGCTSRFVACPSGKDSEIQSRRLDASLE